MFLGNIPNSTNDIGKEMDGTVCVPGIHTACDNTYSIKILNCGSFRVYKLKKPNTCPQAYCFGKFYSTLHLLTSMMCRVYELSSCDFRNLIE